jgi:hypothetical protein
MCTDYYIVLVYVLIMLNDDWYVILANSYLFYMYLNVYPCNLMMNMLVAFLVLLIKCIVFDILTFIWDSLLTLCFVYLLDLRGSRFSAYVYGWVVGDTPLWLGHGKWFTFYV